MGYYSRLSGGFKIDPPITYREFVDAGYDMEDITSRTYSDNTLDLLDGWGELYFTLDIETEQRVEDEGEVTVRKITSSRIDAYDDQMKAYELSKSVSRLVKDFGSTHTFSGTVMVHGEEDGDIWRIRFQDNEALEERPSLQWPDGSVTKL